MKKYKVFVTGAGGFLGQYIVRDLLKEGHEVITFNRNFYHELNLPNVTQLIGNVLTLKDLVEGTRGVDAIIHTASKVGMWGTFDDFYQTNVVGTENVLQAAKINNINKLIYTSTPSVVFGNNHINNANESTPYPNHYLNHYGHTKSVAEKKVLEANSNTLATLSLRPHLIFGPGDKNLIPKVLELAKKNKLRIVGDGNNLVDVSYVENVSSIHVNALSLLETNPAIRGKAYFIGQGPIKLWDFINTILDRYKIKRIKKKIPLKIVYFLGYILEKIYALCGQFKKDPPMTRFVALQLGMNHYFNHENAENDLGFRPQISIEEGIERLLINNHR